MTLLRFRSAVILCRVCSAPLGCSAGTGSALWRGRRPRRRCWRAVCRCQTSVSDLIEATRDSIRVGPHYVSASQVLVQRIKQVNVIASESQRQQFTCSMYLSVRGSHWMTQRAQLAATVWEPLTLEWARALYERGVHIVRRPSHDPTRPAPSDAGRQTQQANDRCAERVEAVRPTRAQKHAPN